MKQLLLLITSILIVSSCTEKMDVELDSTYTRLSVEAKITTDFKKHFVKLSESSDVFFNQDAIPVTNATIQVNDGTSNFSFEETSPGYYESSTEFSGIPGKTYFLSILNVDLHHNGKLESYEAQSLMPYPHKVDSIAMNYDDNYRNEGNDNKEYWLLSLYLKDNKENEDYYGFACQINNVLVHDTITEVVIAEDTFFNGEASKGVEVGFFDQEKPDEIIRNNDLITLETYALTEDYLDFVNELQFMDMEQIPLFSGPPANIRTNISNNAIGFFAVYSITRTSTIVKVE
ncbi:hypothetical protein BZG02_03285 [Labilibaculum filiforme]|uniref:DUF4249 domain-containing protein n=1 Tax=Labilibaculum filiforme TaxID=1940526 RepID=A0A2N3I3L1_9BACT|nr:DUF4249 domain-containing protein [Labilibaculum filiforme]PKQ64888.1 hypothetical protein BZG02_03285 [Labilibaculum filiforme]